MDICEQKISNWALDVIEIESQAISNLSKSIDGNFVAATKLLLACQGKVVVIGMGKSGHVAKKIAATLASTGTSAFFVHPGEALHGDLGMISKNDIVLILSNSGETPEVMDVIPVLKRLNVKLISFTGNPNSSLAIYSDVHVNVAVAKEACALGLAPTSSTTAAMVMGDALAMTLLNAKGFTAEDFARSHPGGKLGKKLLIKIEDVMHKGEKIPIVHKDVTLVKALYEMSIKCLGMTLIVDDNQNPIGVFTDGDLRRTLDKGIDVHSTPIKDVMTTKFKFVSSQMLASSALTLMEENKILVLPVIDDDNIVGAFNMHDLFRAGVA